MRSKPRVLTPAMRHLRWLLPVAAVLAIATAELQDARAAAWQSAGTLSHGRVRHTTTLLATGEVLVVGGRRIDDTADTARADGEVYNEDSNSWRASDVVSPGAASLATARFDHTATLLFNGSVLIAGGQTGTAADAVTASAEIYTPGYGFTPTASMATPRAKHTATLMPDGRVLVVGGRSRLTTDLNSAELYDPVAGSWSPLQVQGAATLRYARYGHSATLLSDGTVLIAGGAYHFVGQTVADKTFEIFDPTYGFLWSDSWGTMAQARVDHSATFLPNGRVLVAGGDVYGTEDGTGASTASVEIFDSTDRVFRTAPALSVGRKRHGAARLENGDVLVVGGIDQRNALDATYLSSAEVYSVELGTWTRTVDLGLARGFASATTLPNWRILIAAGFNPATTPTLVTGAERYDAGPVGPPTTGCQSNQMGSRVPTPTSFRLLVPLSPRRCVKL